MSGRKKPEFAMYSGAETKGMRPATPRQRAGPGPWGRQRRSERIEIFLRFTFCTGLELNCLLLLTADKVTNLGN